MALSRRQHTVWGNSCKCRFKIGWDGETPGVNSHGLDFSGSRQAAVACTDFAITAFTS